MEYIFFTVFGLKNKPQCINSPIRCQRKVLLSPAPCPGEHHEFDCCWADQEQQQVRESVRGGGSGDIGMGWAGFSFIHLLAPVYNALKAHVHYTHTHAHTFALKQFPVSALNPSMSGRSCPPLRHPATPWCVLTALDAALSLSDSPHPFPHFPKTKNKPRLVLMKNFVHRIRIIKNKTKKKNQNEKPENSHMRTRTRRAKLFKGCNFWTPNKNIRKCCMKINLVFLISLL